MTKRYPISQPSLTDLETNMVFEAVQSGWVSSMGKFIDMFETEFAKFCETEHAVAVANGTVAIHLALKALDIGPGDEVIIPDLSFIATANAVLMAGAKPVFADIERESLGLCALDLEQCLTDRTRAVMPVHLYGHPANMPEINLFAERHGLAVIEDSAEAHGAKVNDKPVGGLGTMGTFSFYGNKVMTTGEGGMITTNDAALAQRCRTLRDHAMSSTKRYWHEEMGYNYRMTNMQAALGCAQLQRKEELLGGRQEILEWYREFLDSRNDIQLNRHCSWATPVNWLVCAEFEGLTDESRSTFMTNLGNRGVDTRPYFYPMSDMPYLEQADTPVTHEISVLGLNLPTYLGLTKSDIGDISEILIEERDKLRLRNTRC
eukprot:TRINITY_DN8371_c0_g1_i1.p1 TRINITY_DN8371_c0_g1~~TRINITY_DN8371_c0_g1_i1.p1  ORF type:complete len:375 (+),score=27.73 TRINITY_DN8371_c0_g1_i1:449-1573(+)